MYENAFNKIERELRNEEGVANELDYVEQTSWVQPRRRFTARSSS